MVAQAGFDLLGNEKSKTGLLHDIEQSQLDSQLSYKEMEENFAYLDGCGEFEEDEDDDAAEEEAIELIQE